MAGLVSLRRMMRLVWRAVVGGFRPLVVCINSLANVFRGADPRGAPRIVVSVERTRLLPAGVCAFLYVRLLRRQGARPRWVSHDEARFRDEGGHPGDPRVAAWQALEGAAGLLLTGGSDLHPTTLGLSGGAWLSKAANDRRDRFERALMIEARRRGLPIMAICRGCQLMNVVSGGTLRSLRADARLSLAHRRIRPHRVLLEPDSRAARIVDTTVIAAVRSVHSQAVEQVAPGFRRVGWAPDDVTEVIETEEGGPWELGIQWHPELMLFRAHDRRLIQSFVEAAAHWRPTDQVAPEDDRDRRRRGAQRLC